MSLPMFFNMVALFPIGQSISSLSKLMSESMSGLNLYIPGFIIKSEFSSINLGFYWRQALKCFMFGQFATK